MMPNSAFRTPHSELQIALPSGLTIPMIWVEGGTFRMGSEAHRTQLPIHNVRVEGFYLGKYPVIQEWWPEVMDIKNPSGYRGDKRPVENLSWLKAQRFIKRLNKLSGQTFRLPSEAEWEYAAGGGQLGTAVITATDHTPAEARFRRRNTSGKTLEVGLLGSNELGICDIGNVCEWCEDDWHDNYRGAPDNGMPWIDQPQRSNLRVVRGATDYPPGGEAWRPAWRTASGDDVHGEYIGFRLALTPG